MQRSLRSHYALVLLVVLLLLLSSHFTSATRVLNPLQVEKKVGVDDRDDIFDLMGEVECGNGDEECLKRRMVAEAHLDYIYTQGLHHKP